MRLKLRPKCRPRSLTRLLMLADTKHRDRITSTSNDSKQHKPTETATQQEKKRYKRNLEMQLLHSKHILHASQVLTPCPPKPSPPLTLPLPLFLLPINNVQRASKDHDGRCEDVEDTSLAEGVAPGEEVAQGEEDEADDEVRYPYELDEVYLLEDIGFARDGVRTVERERC